MIRCRLCPEKSGQMVKKRDIAASLSRAMIYNCPVNTAIMLFTRILGDLIRKQLARKRDKRDRRDILLP